MQADAEKVTMDASRTKITATSRKPARTLVDMVDWLRANHIELLDIYIKRPTLEESFIELTGKSLRE